MNTAPTSPRTRRSARDCADRTLSYKPEYADQVRKLCLLLGADDRELEHFFAVPPDALSDWLVTVPEFATAVHAGRTLADAEVADRPWRRAVGYSHQAVRIFSHQGNALECSPVISTSRHGLPSEIATLHAAWARCSAGKQYAWQSVTPPCLQ